MHPPFLFLPHFLSLKTFLFLSISFPRYVASDDQSYTACTPFDCGEFAEVSYPFWGNGRPDYCGHPKFKLDCEEGNVTINIASQTFHVINISFPAHTMRIARMDLWGSKCAKNYTNASLDFAVFNSTSNDDNSFLLYDCDDHPLTSSLPAINVTSFVNFTCPINGVSREAYFLISTSWGNVSVLGCKSTMMVSVLKEAIQSYIKDALDVGYVLDQGFEIMWEADCAKCEECIESGGRCGYNVSMDQFRCFCLDQPYAHGICGNNLLLSPSPSELPDRETPRKWIMKLIVGVSAALFSAIVVSIAFYIFHRRKKNHYAKSYIQSQTISSDSSLKDPDKGSKYFGVHLFSYSELEEATSYFDSAKELGDGGFGTVYYGTLRDGRGVAVKRLYETNGKRVEQFMNEVEILTRLRHPNLVSLYGCTSRHSRELLLVYEYIPNGTVADHLHGEQEEPHKLPWNIRMNIAIETASALAYLHASDIIHRDVKTTNILLDNSFRVKVADFGLSRLFPNDVTHISTAPQGTPGYVDPEYHECYQLTDRSDVYSFGVVLMELISSMPAVDITRHRHEINLSSMAINKIQNRALHELVDPSLGFESDYKVRKMINAVAELAFQCLQSLKDMRPPMEEVLERLKDIQSDGKTKTKAEEMDISADDALLLKNEPPPASPDSQLRSTSTTPNASA